MHSRCEQDDAAHAVVSKLLAKLNGCAKAARIMVSQAATSSSQKICNLQAGIKVCIRQQQHACTTYCPLRASVGD